MSHGVCAVREGVEQPDVEVVPASDGNGLLGAMTPCQPSAVPGSWIGFKGVLAVLMFALAVAISVLLLNIDLASTVKSVDAVVLQRNLVEQIYYSREGGNMTGSDIILWPHPSSATVPHKLQRRRSISG